MQIDEIIEQELLNFGKEKRRQNHGTNGLIGASKCGDVVVYHLIF